MDILKLESNAYNINDNADITIEKAGHITKVKYVSYKNDKAHIQKLNADEYVLLRTGEIFDFDKSENRSDSLYGISVSLSKLRDYINANVTDYRKCHWITLTYRQRDSDIEEKVPMRDTKRLYKDFQMCVRAIRRDYKNDKIEYIGVAEPQWTGSWHMHLILIWDRIAPFIANDILREKYWRQGFVNINKIDKKCDNIGAYFSAYLADIEYRDGDPLADGAELKEIIDKNGNTKKYIKGGRLHFYPPGMNLYRISRGIKAPEKIKAKYGDIDSMGLGALTYTKNIMLVKDGMQPLRVCHEYYNSKRVADKFLSIKEKLQNQKC